MQTIYLDYNSTTPMDSGVADEMMRVHQMQLLNPSSQHRLGQSARKFLEQLKTEIVQNLGGRHQGMDADRLIVTSGGTESNNLLLMGLARARRRTQSSQGHDVNRVIVSSIEHPSLLMAADFLETQGFEVCRAPCDADGQIQLDELERLIDERTALVSMMIANHETGVIQPARQVSEICRARNVPFHTDASQAIGKIPVSFSLLDCDAMTISPHKFCGPRGIGGLLVRHQLEVDPLLYGGAQQLASRPGTESIALVAGFRHATRLIPEKLAQSDSLKAARDLLETILLERHPASAVHGCRAKRLPNTSNIGFPNVDRQALLMASDMAGICFSTGSACASGSSEPSPVLTAMGLPESLVTSSIRLSLGGDLHRDQVESAAVEIAEIVARLNGS